MVLSSPSTPTLFWPLVYEGRPLVSILLACNRKHQGRPLTVAEATALSSAASLVSSRRSAPIILDVDMDAVSLTVLFDEMDGAHG